MRTAAPLVLTLALVGGSGAAALPVGAAPVRATPGAVPASPAAVAVPAAPAAAVPAAPAERTRPAVAPRTTELDLPAVPGTRAASLAGRVTQRFGLVGVTWPYRADSEQVVVQVRVRTAGVWGGWLRLHVDDEHGPDPSQPHRGRSGTEPLWVGSADGVQAKVTTTDGSTVRGAKVALVDPGSSADDAPRTMASAGDTTPATTASRAPYPMPRIYTRRGWGADESLRRHNGADCATPRYTGTIRAAFVHHTAGSNSYTKTQSAQIIRGVYAYHVKNRGWCDLGYSFLVDKYGQAFEGRYGGMHLPVLGAHTGSFNTNSFGISLMGNFETAVPGRGSALEATARVIAWKLDANYRAPFGRVNMNGRTLNVISGHRDTKSTACPGKNVYSQLSWLRSRVSVLMGYGYGTEIYNFSRQLGGEAKIGPPWWGEHVVAGGRGTWYTHRDLYWSGATGANSVYGSFRTRHRRLRHAAGPLGFPSSEQQSGRLPGTQVQEFAKSGTRAAMYWSSSTGPREVYGGIMYRYVRLGAELSRLRMPATSPYAVTGGLQQKFQGGTITWNRTTGTTTVRYS